MCKYFLNLSIRMLLCFCLVTGCDNPWDNDNATDDNDTTIDEELTELLDPEPISLPGDSSFNMIDDAARAGSINEAEAMRLRILAGFDPEKLPAAYASPVQAARSSLQTADRWIENNWDSLSSSLQAELTPYYVLPDDAESYLNQSSFKDLITALATPTGWPYITVTVAAQPDATPPVSERSARVHYQSESDAVARQQAQWIAAAFQEAYPRFAALLDVNPGQDIYMYVHPGITDKGLAKMKVINGARRGRIYIQKGLAELQTKATLAHELFHVFQDYLSLDYSPDDEQWLMEATAAWSENYIYPDYNTEHEYLTVFFNNLDQSLISDGSVGYTAYPWFLFLTQMLHYDGVVSEILHEAASHTVTSVIADKPYFDGYFAQYALWNWNQDPVLYYRDNPSFPGSPLGGESYQAALYEPNRQYTSDIILGPLSIMYSGMVINDRVDKIKYEFDAAGDSKHRRQALVFINGTWSIEDWTGLTERTFCRNRDQERVDAVVLIASNADAASDFEETFRIDTRSRCAPTWHGTTQVRRYYHFMESGTELTVSGDFTVHTIDGTYNFATTDELVQDEDGDLRVVRQFASYSGIRIEEINYERSCGYLKEFERDDIWGSVNNDYTGQDNPPRRWEIKRNDLGIPTELVLHTQTGSSRDWITDQEHQVTTIAHCVVKHYIEYATDDNVHYNDVYFADDITIPADNMTAMRIEGELVLTGEDCTSCGTIVHYRYAYD